MGVFFRNKIIHRPVSDFVTTKLINAGKVNLC